MRARRYFLHLSVFLLSLGIGAATSKLHSPHRSPRVLETLGPELRSACTQTSTPASPSDPDCPPAFVKTYLNYDYAYSVSVPKGMIGYGACDTNHGFGINLLDPTSNWWTNHAWPKSYLSVDASYNSAESISADEEVAGIIKFLKDKKGVSTVTLMVKTPTRLAHLAAVRAVIYYNEGGEAMVEDSMVAIRRQRSDESGIIYSIDLSTPMSRYEQDKVVLAQIQKSWRVCPLPNP
jgi:hypothetical protein